ncbi:hypothetical protein BRE01_46170 [Brevibacillus reuszeri]|uniref:Uncharacterized protein n=1 Tax=Brevibacillus reuszeri TaxID=54915 RepID=A0A0K9YMS6_9BACL|nr:hypothetical protein [Brevibacillus reuszeri]KNB69470.1 hypothetical protein ADS79_26685 [Brevibacillus reuszeri]MED1861549.1 hypothetical protein [Brevibacillus reuszeri]GED70915.1 hypothetical protein BRE01_46170 [Brevibacillus reuszeri]
MATERKPVCFNVNDPLEKEMWEISKTLNFSAWAKGHLKPIALARIAERHANKELKRVGVPVPVRRVVAADAPST